MSLGLSFTSDVIPFDENWHHLYTQLLQEENIFPMMPDQGDWPNGARDMHKNAQKVE